MSDERPPGGDETRPMPPVPGADPDVPPAAVPPLDATRPSAAVPPLDVPVPPADATRPMPAADAGTRPFDGPRSHGPRSDDRDNRIWSGRAEVRPPSPERTEYYETDWADPAPAGSQGRWWAPIAVGGAALILLGLLGFGIAVILQNSGDETPAAAPATTVATTVATTAATSGTTVPTTEPTTTQPLEPTPTTTEPLDAEVTVPALRGMPLADAQAALDRSGLTYRVIRRGSEAEPETVIDSDPPEGRLVPSDTRITLVVAAEPSPGPASTTTAPTAEPDED